MYPIPLNLRYVSLMSTEYHGILSNGIPVDYLQLLNVEIISEPFTCQSSRFTQLNKNELK